MIKTILLIINVISFALTVVFGIFGIYEQIMGPSDAKKLLNRLKIPLSYNQTLLIGFICVVVMIISYIIRKNL